MAIPNNQGRNDLDGGSGGSPTGGGGTPGTGTGSTGSVGLPTGENGGVLATTYLLFVPVQDSSSGLCYIGTFSSTNFDDSRDGGSYSYRQEDIAPDAVATVHRIWITYRDLGAAKFTITLSGTNDDGQVVTSSAVVQVGNVVPTNALFTEPFGLQLTCFRPQLTISRVAGSGPISIVRIRMEGETEEF